MARTRIYRRDYQSYPFSIPNISLTFDVQSDQTVVTNVMHFQRQFPGDLILKGKEFELVDIELNDSTLSESQFNIKDDELLIKNCPEEFSLKVVTRLKPQENTALIGLYKSDDVLCAICEPEGFRHISYHPDRPDVLSIYETTIIADETYPVLLCGGNLIDSGTIPDGRHWAKWQDQAKKPSYLFNLFAGDFSCVQTNYVTRSGKDVTISMYVEKGNESKCDYALSSLKEAMRFDEQQFDLEYDLDEYKIVTINKLNFAAHESKGLAIFGNEYILASEFTKDEQLEKIKSNVAHVYFNHAFLSNVAIRDWFELFLPAGLAAFRRQKFTENFSKVNRLADILEYRNSLDVHYTPDSIRSESIDEIDYSVALYNKCPEVLRMLETIVTEDGFRNGLKAFFENNKGNTVVLEDFLAAMLTGNHDIYISKFIQWFDEAGSPIVTVNSNFNQENSILTLKFTQNYPYADTPYYVPIKTAFFSSTGELIGEELIEVQENEVTFNFVFEQLEEKPIVSLLRNFSAPVILQDNLSITDRLKLVEFETDLYQKWMNLCNLSLNELTAFYYDIDNVGLKTARMSGYLAEAFKNILLDETLDKKVRAQLLQIPSTQDLVRELVKESNPCDIVAVEKVRAYFEEEIGFSLLNELKDTYDNLKFQEDNNIDKEGIARRALKNRSLSLLMRSNRDDRTLSNCYAQCDQENSNITDRLHSLYLVNLYASPDLRNVVLNDFYNQYKDNKELMIEWFAIQAMSQDEFALERIKELTQHPAFDWQNPYIVRALVDKFAWENYLIFHNENGTGYEFLRDALLKIDPINPQLAADLSTSFSAVGFLNQTRGQMVVKNIKWILFHDISDRLRNFLTTELSILMNNDVKLSESSSGFIKPPSPKPVDLGEPAEPLEYEEEKGDAQKQEEEFSQYKCG